MSFHISYKDIKFLHIFYPFYPFYAIIRFDRGACNMKQQNGNINLLKFLFSISILLLHVGAHYGFYPWTGSWIAVEWFFVFAGYTLTSHIYRIQSEKTFSKDSAKYILKRIGTFYPYFIVACICALILILYSGRYTITSFRRLPELLPDILLLQMFGFDGSMCTWYTGISWFLSALVICLIVFYVILMKYKRTFDRTFAIIIPLFIYGYIDITTGCLWGPSYWMGFCYKGLLRGIAGFCLGAFSYNIGLFLKSRVKPNQITKWIVAVMYIIIFYTMYKWDDSKIYYLFPYLFAFLIAADMTNENGLVPDNTLTRFLGKISMIIYMTHYSWCAPLKTMLSNVSAVQFTLYVIAGTAVTSAIVYFLGKPLSLLWKKIFQL